MPTKISDLNLFPVENDSSNLYTLGYDGADTGTKTNYRINLKEFIDKQLESSNINSNITSLNTLLSNFSDNIVIKNFMGDVEFTVTDTISKLIDEINNIDGTTSSADITKIQNYKDEIEDVSKKLAQLLEGEDINEDELLITTELGNLLNLIKNKIEYLDANIGTGSSNNTDADILKLETRIENTENEIENLEVAIGINNEIDSSKLNYFPENYDNDVLKTYIDLAKNFNTNLFIYKTYEDGNEIIDKNIVLNIYNNIKNYRDQIANYFPIGDFDFSSINSIETDERGYISYSSINDTTSNIKINIALVNDLILTIKKFNSEPNGEHINSLNEFKNELENNENTNSLQTLLETIKTDYNLIETNLTHESVTNKWLGIEKEIDGLEDFINNLNKLTIEEIKNKISELLTTLNNNFISINYNQETNIFNIASLVEENIKNINSELDLVFKEKIIVNKTEQLKKLAKNYNEIEIEFKNLTKVKFNNSGIIDVTINAAIVNINNLLQDPEFNTNKLSSTYVNEEISKAINKYNNITTIIDLEDYITHIKNISNSKSFVQPKEAEEDKFNTFFENLEINLTDYNYYWINGIAENLKDINRCLYDITLVAFINRLKDGKYLESKIIENTNIISENINSEIEVLKNNLVTIANNFSEKSGLVEEDLDPVIQSVASLSIVVDTLDNKVTNEIPARINIETNKVRESLDSKIVQQTNDITNFKNNIQNYNGFIRFDEEPEKITVDEENVALTLDEQNYYKLEVNESGILYIIKGESTNIKFIPYTKDNDNNLNINDFYKNLYCPEEGLNVPFIIISILKNNGILLPEGFTEKFYFSPYLSITEIDNIIKE